MFHANENGSSLAPCIVCPNSIPARGDSSASAALRPLDMRYARIEGYNGRGLAHPSEYVYGIRSQLLQAAAQCTGGAMACMNFLSGDLVLIVLAV